MWCHCRHWKPRVRPHWEKQQLPPKQLQVPSALWRLSAFMDNCLLFHINLSKCHKKDWEQTWTILELFGARQFCICTVCIRVCVLHPESVEYEAQDISVRVMSPQSVLVSWVHPALETGKVDPQVARWESVKASVAGRNAREATAITYFPFLLTQVLHS